MASRERIQNVTASAPLSEEFLCSAQRELGVYGVSPVVFVLVLTTSMLMPLRLPAFSGNGSGSETDPYLIENVDQLQEIKLDLSAHYALAADIDALATAGWNVGAGFEPVGDSGPTTGPFTGVLDGRGFSINHLTINRPTETRVGLFRNLNGQVVDLNFQDSAVFGAREVGVLAANASGAVSDCSSSGTVEGRGGIVGGLIGRNFAALSNCESTGTVRGEDQVGGMVGFAEGGRLLSCRVWGNVETTTETASSIGGLIGDNLGSVQDCHTTVAVSGQSGVGGLIGDNRAGGLPVSGCSAAGIVSGDDLVGGLVGLNESTFTLCRASAQVTGRVNVGGLVGGTFTAGVLNSHANGNVARSGDPAGGGVDGTVGGLVGFVFFATVENCLASGDVESDVGGGGFVGWMNGGIVRDCCAGGSVSGRRAAGGSINLGGLIAAVSTGTVSRCRATGDVSGNGNLGGLVGVNRGEIFQCAALGAVVENDQGSNTSERCGGLAGQNHGVVRNCYATGAVTDTGTDNAEQFGGLVGSNSNGTIENAYAVGLVSRTSGTSNQYGGLIGGDSGTVLESFWDRETTNMDTSPGSDPSFGKTTAEMRQQATFTAVGWDFSGETANGTEDIWSIQEGINYPHFQTAGGAFSLTVFAEHGTVFRSPDLVLYGSCTQVTLTAIADTGYRFCHWTGDVPAGRETGNPLRLAMDGAKAITAVFELETGVSPLRWRLY